MLPTPLETLPIENQPPLALLPTTAHQVVDRAAHEFRTPLTVIQEFATVLRDGLVGQVTPRQQELLDVVHDRADDLAVMVDDLLDASKAEAGVLRAWRRASRVEEIVSHVRGTLARKAAVKKVAFQVALEENLPTVYCDPDKIGRVIVSLASNAIKFCREGEPVRLWARRDPAAFEVVVGVTDGGPGIARHRRKRIFQPFYRATHGSRRDQKGLGLGLSVARELAALSLAEITVQSELERGSTFSLGLPEDNFRQLIGRYLRWLDKAEDGACPVSLVVAETDPSVEPRLSNLIDEFLQEIFPREGMALRILPHRWLVMLPRDEPDVEPLVAHARDAWTDATGHPERLFPTIRYRTEGTWPLGPRVAEAIRRLDGTLRQA